MNELQIVEQSMMPIMDIEGAVNRFNELGQFVKTIMKKDIDYGIVPGTAKDTLLKPGAEKLCTFFGLTKEVEVIEKEQDWTGKDHGGEPFFYYWYRIRLSRNGYLVAEADGSANSWETKYRYRQAERKCPKCGKETIFRSKQDGGGWFCWAKKGGCGSQFKDGDQSIEKQDLGKVKNPNPADLANTIQKMAYKRALVAATLVAVNASEYFTQDVEDFEVIDVPFKSEPIASPAPKAETKKPSEGSTTKKQKIVDPGASQKVAQESWDSREEDLAEIRNLVEQTGTDEARMLAHYKLPDLESMNKEQAGATMNILIGRLAAMSQ